MRAVCIDSSNKPGKVPENEWIKEGKIYTITRIVRMGFQDNVFGVLLKEVQLSFKSFPYELYDMSRFLPIDLLTEVYSEKKETVKEADLELI
jgi:hypothetical protein